MMWYYGGWGWLWMSIMMVIFWGSILALAVWTIRSFGGAKRDGNAAMDTLRQRLASGAITQEEFEKTKKMLQGS
jgi:putative membrane protein